jgi:hypothetical protein
VANKYQILSESVPFLLNGAEQIASTNAAPAMPGQGLATK